MPTLIFKVDCGELGSDWKHELERLENKVQEALTEVDYNYLVFRTEYLHEALLDLEDAETSLMNGPVYTASRLS